MEEQDQEEAELLEQGEGTHYKRGLGQRPI